MVRKTLACTAIVASLVLGAAGCSPTDGGSPPAADQTQPGNGDNAAAQLSAKGLDPYVVGASADTLKAAGAVGPLTDIAGCPGWASADATGALAGTIRATFHNGALAWIEVNSSKLSTVEGAIVGMSSGELKGLYSGQATDLKSTRGTFAIGVPEDADTGFLFRMDDDNVSAIEAGTYPTIQSRFVKGAGC